MLNMGILAAGGIAHSMAKTLSGMYREDGRARLYAVASRSQEKADAFAREQGAEKAYGSYEQMLEDPSVDLVYVASPHSHHAEHMKLCLAYGKPVLCEKAFTANAAQAREVLEEAEKKQILVTEAIWTRYMPYRRMLNDLIEKGTIGKVHTVTANLGYDIDTVPRLVEPSLAGGALLDVGVYCLNFASMVLGNDIERMQASALYFTTGCDRQDTIALMYRSGAMASLMCSAMCLTDRVGTVYGEDGWLKVDNINNPSRIEVWKKEQWGQEPAEVISVPRQITGYEYQVDSCIRALREGRIECEEMPHAETLSLMEQMDSIRQQTGVVYPFDA